MERAKARFCFAHSENCKIRFISCNKTSCICKIFFIFVKKYYIMKKFLLSLTLFGLNILIHAQVGINTAIPTKTLDINGETRIRTLPPGAVVDDVIVVDADGNLKKVARSSFGSTSSTTNTNILGYTPQPIANKIVPATAPGGATVQEVGCKQWSGNGHYYCAYQLSAGTNWFNTFDFAKQLGGYLPTLTGDAERAWMNTNILASYSLNNNIWIGYNKIQEPGNPIRFRWITGEEFNHVWSTNPATVENWFNVGEPNNSGGSEGYSYSINC